jgi:KaiC/GvpD/RAD55 family RecA-like ATPase
MRLEIGDVEKKKDWIEILERIIREGVESCGYSILAIDSLEALYALADVERPRRDLFHFFGFFKDLGTTTFFISEVPFGVNGLARNGEDFLADGIIYLKHFDIRETDVQLRLRIVKMRRARHDQGYFALNFNGGKFFVTKAILE